MNLDEWELDNEENIEVRLLGEREESEEQLKGNAKEDEIRSYKENRVYEEIERNGEHGLSSRWIITKKIKQGKENQTRRRKVEGNARGARF